MLFGVNFLAFSDTTREYHPPKYCDALYGAITGYDSKKRLRVFEDYEDYFFFTSQTDPGVNTLTCFARERERTLFYRIKSYTKRKILRTFNRCDSLNYIRYLDESKKKKKKKERKVIEWCSQRLINCTSSNFHTIFVRTYVRETVAPTYLTVQGLIGG